MLLSIIPRSCRWKAKKGCTTTFLITLLKWWWPTFFCEKKKKNHGFVWRQIGPLRWGLSTCLCRIGSLTHPVPLIPLGMLGSTYKEDGSYAKWTEPSFVCLQHWKKNNLGLITIKRLLCFFSFFLNSHPLGIYFHLGLVMKHSWANCFTFIGNFVFNMKKIK